jgi:hypothetical protein
MPADQAGEPGTTCEILWHSRAMELHAVDCVVICLHGIWCPETCGDNKFGMITHAHAGTVVINPETTPVNLVSAFQFTALCGLSRWSGDSG